MQFPAAYRSLSRLSSAPSAKAFALRPSSLDHQFAIFRLLLKASYTLIANKICYSLPVETVVSSSSKFYFISFRSYYSVLKVHLFEVPFTGPSKLNNIDLLSRHRQALKLKAQAPARLPRKEVIQPQVLLRLPCYDFTPITSFTFGGVPLAVRLPTSGPPGSHGVTGGVYKARERIHRSMLICDY